MDWKYWIGIIAAGIPGVVSLIILFFDRPKLTFKIMKNSLEFLHPDKFGQLIKIDNEINIDRYKDDNLHCGIKIEIIISNKGNKKATVNQIIYKNSKCIKEIKIDNNLIPVDVGESIKKKFYIPLKNINEVNCFYGELGESPILLAIDHRDKKHCFKLNKPKIDTQ